ncbi:hypothetical protein M5K25_016477 [Dendrobium thyrsiflorum]|uniref:Uncharacterized protein n=1 Tax=Dendrobium thyrsiflorum TaxID=117978 RepID=A0ABD0US01_DENTH
MLRLVRQLQPKIVLVVDEECDRNEFPFSHHFFRAFQSSMALLDSIDAVSSNLDMTNKIERFVLLDSIEKCIIWCHRAADKLLPWRTLSGFVPAQFSNFTEMLVECLLEGKLFCADTGRKLITPLMTRRLKPYKELVDLIPILVGGGANYCSKAGTR